MIDRYLLLLKHFMSPYFLLSNTLLHTLMSGLARRCPTSPMLRSSFHDNPIGTHVSKLCINKPDFHFYTLSLSGAHTLTHSHTQLPHDQAASQDSSLLRRE